MIQVDVLDVILVSDLAPSTPQPIACRWPEIAAAVQQNIAASYVLDASIELATNATGSAATDSVISIRSRALVTPSGGYVANPDMVLSHGTGWRFPPGIFLVKLMMTDEYGLTGVSLIGVCSHSLVQLMLMPSRSSCLPMAANHLIMCCRANAVFCGA